MIGVKLFNGWGKKYPVRISDEGALSVILETHPRRDEEVAPLPLREFFKNSSNSSDMLVNGATTPQEFYIPSSVEYDIFIKSCLVTIVDQNAVLNQFGNLTALTNGLDFEWQTASGNLTIADQIKTNYDFVTLSLGNPPVGDGAGAFRASNVQGASEGYAIAIDFQKIFGMPYGIRLRKSSNEKLLFRINDNVSTMDRFDAIGYGIKI